MTARVVLREADIRRGLRAALEAIKGAGLSPADFKIVHKDGEITLLPASGSEAPSEAEDLEQRMRDAFGA